MAVMRQAPLFAGARLRLDQAIQQSLDSLRAYGPDYRHWALAYSGGKDSTAALTFVLWALREGHVAPPETLTVLYADTRLELPVLYSGAQRMLQATRALGWTAQTVRAALDDRFLVYMLGYGVPPPSNTFRWCTPKIKVKPMEAALAQLRERNGTKLLMLTGVRVGESAARDQRIAVSCAVNGGECGQGWFQMATPASVADTLAPLLHWRLCHVFDWLYFDPEGHGLGAAEVAAVYGENDVRSGCVGCPLASRDFALENLVSQPQHAHLRPLLELKPLWRALKTPQWRKRKTQPEKRRDGTYGRNAQRMGPLTMDGRAYGLARILDIQQRAGVCLIDASEEARIREMWRLDMWPRKWSRQDAAAAAPLDAALTATNGGHTLVVQPFLW